MLVTFVRCGCVIKFRRLLVCGTMGFGVEGSRGFHGNKMTQARCWCGTLNSVEAGFNGQQWLEQKKDKIKYGIGQLEQDMKQSIGTSSSISSYTDCRGSTG